MADQQLRTFGRNESPPDPRDFNLGDFMPKRLYFMVGQSRKWDYPSTPLDQGKTAHCVGFGMAHFGINLPTMTMYSKEDAHNFYYKCKEEEGEPGQENGAFIRSAAKVLQDMGAIEVYAFALTVSHIKWWLLNRGPLIVGTVWTEEMMKPDADNKLDTSGYFLGGHAYLINEWTEDNYIGIKNSWGPDWGTNGKAYISASAFEELFMYGGEALAAVELEDYLKKKHSFPESVWVAIKAFIEDFWRLLMSEDEQK